MAISISPALRAVVASHGIALPQSCEADDLLPLMPGIIQAVTLSHQCHTQEVAKSALIIQSVNSYCPNSGLIRSESVSDNSPDPGYGQGLESLLPI